MKNYHNNNTILSSKYPPKNNSFRDILDIIDSNINNNQQDLSNEISIYTQPIPEPPCVLLRWRFLVQAQFYTHMGYKLHIDSHQNIDNYYQDSIIIKSLT